MKRREFITLLGGAAAAWPLVARAQQSRKMLRLGMASVQPRTTAIYVAFLQRMRELGYEEGDNFFFDYIQARNVDGYVGAYQELAKRNPDILFATGPEIALQSALAAARGAIPVVMVAVDYDPLARGYVTNLARPAGNLTGIYFQQIELTGKRLQLIKTALPNLQSIMVFWDRISADQWQAAQSIAPGLGLRLVSVQFREQPYDYEGALRQLPPEDRRALVVLTSPVFAVPERALLPQFALRHRIPSIFSLREYIDEGGLMSYGASFKLMYRHIADYVHRLAQGEKVTNLPIEQPTKFELVVNLRTAKAIEIALPAGLLAEADEVIE
jgi:putative tryptophan/tyrosine transport system substrate-binding protein